MSTLILFSMPNSLTFTCWNEDKPIEIQLEPEAIVFSVLPGNELTFTGRTPLDDNFKWAIRIEHLGEGIQLMPDVTGSYEIEIFENGILLEDWYKHMRPL
ncbi:hypothetical protein [Hymenobacter sp.]|uniref:hypothetical protein n=1 Tax=Hymenobacter sp. TaxID=1898978 RepID=UPI00286AF049|nr:hypothetical protein [Hymenobacter sp.]